MNPLTVIATFICAGLFVYLIVVLIFPEAFT